MKTVLGVDKDTPIRFDEITNNEKVEQITENVDAQAEVIEQIKAALNGKSSVGVKEIMDIIDQSGVLDSTDGTATEKVEQLIDKAEDENAFYEGFELINQTISNMFGSCTFEKAPKINPINIPNAPYWYSGCLNLKLFDFYFNGEKVKNYSSFLNRCVLLEYFEGANTASATQVNGFCQGCRSLHTINRPFDFSNVTSANQFLVDCLALINVSFVLETIKISITIPSPVLSAESIQSIIDGLATVETAQTLTLNATVKAKLTETQLATITSKNWNLA